MTPIKSLNCKLGLNGILYLRHSKPRRHRDIQGAPREMLVRGDNNVVSMPSVSHAGKPEDGAVTFWNI